MAKKDIPEVIAAAPAVVEVTKKTRQVDPNSKTQKCNAIFAECYAMDKVPQRKDILAKAVEATGASPQAAATFLHNYRNKHGMVQHKTAD